MALIAGPTASGKSALALSLAKKAGGVVINADASQVYRDLSVISARPSLAEEAEAPHRLFGYLDGATACSAASWAQDASDEITKALAQGLLPIVVGGTGLYLQTLIDGIAPIPAIDPDIREHVRQLEPAEAFIALSTEDPVASQRLHPTDRTRISRALEVIRSTNKSILQWRQEKTGGIGHKITLVPAILTPKRTLLYERCNQRFDLMMAEGALDEVRALAERGLDPQLPVMRAIGVPPLIDYLAHKTPLDEAIVLAKQATRNYAKRQLTWFNNQPPADWPRFVTPRDALNFLENSLVA